MIDVCRSMALQDTHHYDGKSQYFLYIISTYRAGAGNTPQSFVLQNSHLNAGSLFGVL